MRGGEGGCLGEIFLVSIGQVEGREMKRERGTLHHGGDIVVLPPTPLRRGKAGEHVGPAGDMSQLARQRPTVCGFLSWKPLRLLNLICLEVGARQYVDVMPQAHARLTEQGRLNSVCQEINTTQQKTFCKTQRRCSARIACCQPERLARRQLFDRWTFIAGQLTNRCDVNKSPHPPGQK